MNDQDITAVVKKLVDAGIQLNAVYEPIGCSFCMRPADVAPYLRDRDAFFAAECGLDKADYVEWKRFMEGSRLCGAIGPHGQCKRPVKESAGLSPQEFTRRKAEGTLLCSVHLKAHEPTRR